MEQGAIQITLNGVVIHAKDGQTIVEAARENGTTDDAVDALRCVGEDFEDAAGTPYPLLEWNSAICTA